MNGGSPGNATQEFNIPDICGPIGEASPMPMAGVDGTRHIVRYANPAFCALAGRPKEELVGNSFCAVLAGGMKSSRFLTAFTGPDSPKLIPVRSTRLPILSTGRTPCGRLLRRMAVPSESLPRSWRLHRLTGRRPS